MCLQAYRKKDEQAKCEISECENESPRCLIINQLPYEIMGRVFCFRSDNGLLDYNAVLRVLDLYDLQKDEVLQMLDLIELQDGIISKIRSAKRENEESIERAKNRGTKR